jgi:CheY-like chemotaxis protein
MQEAQCNFETPGPKEFSILYVEDDEDDRRLFLEVVRMSNPKMEVIQAENGEQALTYLFKSFEERTLPGAIISDWQMPLKSGLNLLIEIKQHPCLKKIPFFMFSTSSSFTDANKVKKLGATGYYSKPDSYVPFTETVQQLLFRCQHVRETFELVLQH